MQKKHYGVMLLTIVFVMLFSHCVFAERVLPEKTNAYEEHNPERGLSWLSNQSLIEKIVTTAKNAEKGDESLLTLVQNSIIIHSEKTYGYVNGFRTNMEETSSTLPKGID